MTREELYKMLLEYTPIENHFRFMPKEQQQRENLRFLETFQDAACQEISKRPHKEQIMLLYGLRDSRQSGHPPPSRDGQPALRWQKMYTRRTKALENGWSFNATPDSNIF